MTTVNTVSSPELGKGPSGDTPQTCLERVARVRDRWVMLRRMVGLSQLAATVFVAIGAALVAEYLMRGGTIWRFELLGCILALTVAGVRRFVLPTWSGLSSDSAALLTERAYPDLSGRLVTAIQLAGAGERSRTGASDGLYHQVLRAAEQSARRIEAERVVPGQSPLRQTAIAWALVAVIVLGGVFAGRTTSIALARVITPWRDVAWPQRTQLLIDQAQTPLRVVRGGTLTIEGRIDGVVPATGTLQIAAGERTDRARFAIEPDGGFRVRYRPVNRDLTVWIEAGDARSDGIAVEMVPPPEIASIELECVYPAYTHLPPQRLPDGNLQAVFGSQVRLLVTAGKPIQSATLEWLGGEGNDMHRVDERKTQARFTVTESRSYRVHLRDEHGFTNPEPVRYHVEMIDNLYPRIEQAAPAVDKRVTARAVVPILATVSDDFGVAGLDLCYRVGEEGQVERVSIPVEASARQVEARYAWSLEPMSLDAGTTVTWWLEARDEGDHAKESEWPTSRSRELHVVDEPELARMLNDQLEQVLDALAQLETIQGECADTVSLIQDSLDEASSGTEASRQIRDRVETQKWQQDHLARDAGQLSARLARIAEDYAISRIGDPERAARLKRTADELARIASADMPGIVLTLDEALTNLREAAFAPTAPEQEP